MRTPFRSLVGVAASAVAAAASIGLAAPPAGAATQPVTWNFTQAQIPAAQPMGNYGRGVLVAVVDTWVDFTQPQFGGRVVDEADCLTGTCVDKKYSPDECVHGTHVAGTVASDDYGVAPEADILAVQVLSGPSGSTNDPDAECTGSSDGVAAGIDFAVSKGARVINLSLADEVPGLFQSSAITSAVQNAYAHGDLVVFAAGNDDLPLTDDYGNDALVVAATGPDGQLASYSNYDSPLTGDVDVAAPGGDTGQATTCSTADCVLSTFPHGQLGLLEGTSMAAPHVSGLAALLFAQNPSRGVANVISTIERSATPLAGAGSGLIDAKAALEVEAASHPGTTGPAPSSPNSSGGSTNPAPVAAATAPTPSPAPPGSDRPSDPSGAVAPATTTTTTQRSSPTTARGKAVTAGPGGGLTGRPPSADEPTAAGAAAGAGHPTPSWASRHVAPIVVASVLIVADLLALAWRREVRRVFGAS